MVKFFSGNKINEFELGICMSIRLVKVVFCDKKGGKFINKNMVIVKGYL